MNFGNAIKTNSYYYLYILINVKCNLYRSPYKFTQNANN